MRVPWSQRQNPKQVEQFWQLSDEVPVGLVATLVEHVVRAFYVNDVYGPPVLNRELSNRFARLHNRYFDESLDRAWKILSTDSVLLLDAFDFSLSLLNEDNFDHRRRVLGINFQLTEARFGYHAAPDGKGSFELQKKVTDTFNIMISKSASVDDRASEHLRRALSLIYGKDPDPNTACFEATRAIEVVASPIIAPRSDSMRLGQMIKEIEKQPEKWMTELGQEGDVQVFVSLLRLVLQGHYRHGEEKQPMAPSPATAEMVVQLAVLLTEWFRTKRFSPRSV